MAKRFLKHMEIRDELSNTCNPKVMSRCLSVPDATSLHHCLQYFTYLKLNQALDTKRPVAIPSPFFTASSVLFQLHRGMVSHIQVLPTTSSTVHNIKCLDTYYCKYISFSCLFLRQWCRDVASGADMHLDITFRLQVVESSFLVSVLFRVAFSHTYISFNIHLPVNGFCVTCVHTFFEDPLPSLY